MLSTFEDRVPGYERVMYGKNEEKKKLEEKNENHKVKGR